MDCIACVVGVSRFTRLTANRSFDVTCRNSDNSLTPQKPRLTSQTGHGSLWVTMGHCSPRSLLSVNPKEVSSSLCDFKWINVMARQGTIIVTTLQNTPSWSHASIASWHCMMSNTFVFRFSRLAACIAHGNRITLLQAIEPLVVVRTIILMGESLFLYPINCWQTFHRCLSALVC